MDANELWQENKRWILGVALGAVVFWVASTVIGGVYGTTGASRQIRTARQELAGQAFYTQAALHNAQQEAEQVQASLDELTKAMVFVPGDEFLVAGKGDPDLHFDAVSRRVKRDLLRRADALGVRLLEKDLDWPAPVSEEIQPTLIGLNLLEQVALRLLDAHERVKGWDAEATGLDSIETLRVVAAGRTSGSRARRGASEVVQEEKVSFKVRADEATVKLFLESCASKAPPIALAPDFKMTVGPAPGDPLLVSGTMLALRLP